jgi:hypothetical protein
MRTRFAAALLFLLAGCQQPPAQKAEYRPEEAGTVDHAMCLLGFTAVPLRELATGHHLVDAQLNGRTGTFVLDTGANVSVVHAPLAASYGLPDKGAAGGAFGVGGALNARQVKLESLRLGGIQIRQDRIMTSDLAQIARVLGPVSGGTIAGIIGQDVMKEHRAVIDVSAPILYLVSKDRDPAPVPAERCTAQAPEEKAKAKAKAKSGRTSPEAGAAP